MWVACFPHPIHERFQQPVALAFPSGISQSLFGSFISPAYHLEDRPAAAVDWSDEKVARRWWRLFPRRRNKDGSPAEPAEHEHKQGVGDRRIWLISIKRTYVGSLYRLRTTFGYTIKLAICANEGKTGSLKVVDANRNWLGKKVEATD